MSRNFAPPHTAYANVELQSELSFNLGTPVTMKTRPFAQQRAAAKFARVCNVTGRYARGLTWYGKSGGFGIKPAGLRGRLWLRGRSVRAQLRRGRTNNRRDCQVVVRTFGRPPPDVAHAPERQILLFHDIVNSWQRVLMPRAVTGRNARNFRTSSFFRPPSRRYSSPRVSRIHRSYFVIDGLLAYEDAL